MQQNNNPTPNATTSPTANATVVPATTTPAAAPNGGTTPAVALPQPAAANGGTPAANVPLAPTPSNKGATPAAAPATGKGATFTGITPAMVKAKQPGITAANVHGFVNRAAGGNYSNVAIVFIGSKSGANPMPFANMGTGGKRAQILWAMVNGVPATTKGKPASHNLASYLAYSVARGASKSAMLDLLAALNGGFSQSSKNWGTPYVKLVVTA